MRTCTSEPPAVVVVYHPKYLFGSRWFNFLHPFDFDRARDALKLIRGRTTLVSPGAPASFQELGLVHTPEYLQRVGCSATVARVAEIPFLGWLPAYFMRRWFVLPTRWAVAGTLLATRKALQEGLAVHLSGGFHHAKRDGGEGFCLFNDIAYAVEKLRGEGELNREDLIYYIDLDAHMGNGVALHFKDDRHFRILDLFNQAIYPCHDRAAWQALDVAKPLPAGCGDELYLRALDQGLEELFTAGVEPRLVIYNAGTDVFAGDRLGGLRLSQNGVRQRDRRVLELVRRRGIPLVTLASGGYSPTSATLLADLALAACATEGGASSSAETADAPENLC